MCSNTCVHVVEDSETVVAQLEAVTEEVVVVIYAVAAAGRSKRGYIRVFQGVHVIKYVHIYTSL